MKKIKSILLSLSAIAFFAVSCDDDGGTSQRDTLIGAAPDVQKVATGETFINLNEIQDGNEIAIGVTVGIGIGDVESMDVVAYYIKANGDAERKVVAADVTTFPTTVNFTKQSLIDTFDSLASADDFALGDQLKVSADVTLPSGMVVNLLTATGGQNYGSYLDPSQAPYTVFQTFNVSCPSDLGGTFQTVSTNLSAPTGETEAGPVTGTVTLTDRGGGIYTISDASLGGWIGLYGPGNIASGVSLVDICGGLSLSGVDQYGEVFTYSNLVINGANLSLHWENDYGEFGDTVITRTDGSDWPTNLTLD